MAHHTNTGFTLLEVLVVLTLIGLMAGIVAPDLLTMTDRIAFAMNRERFERGMASLPYEAFRQKKDFLLSSTAKKGAVAEDAAEPLVAVALETAENSQENLVAMPIVTEPAALNIPADWVLKVEPPILYRKLGYCTGGTIDLEVGQARYAYELKAPDCRPVAK
ncbi:MAG: prepilin-type N-terminal cleavage/methylation domain-containing protein [Rhodospirillaceae bacterium]|nr:prepilin-type N-terminal cleavage/methylation domain-containing protein [Rhodospirillaceae bacterium]